MMILCDDTSDCSELRLATLSIPKPGEIIIIVNHMRADSTRANNY